MAVTRQSIRTVRRLLAGVLIAAACGPARAHAAGEAPPGPASGLPVPRFVSLKSDRVNVRGGPTKDHDVAWVYTRAGMPVEITAEFENWRRIRDWEGAEGWVYHSLLSGRRTAWSCRRRRTIWFRCSQRAGSASACDRASCSPACWRA